MILSGGMNEPEWIVDAHGLRRFDGHPLVGEAAGVGLLGVVEVVADPAGKTPFDSKRKVGPKLVAFAQSHGLIVRAMGDRVAFCPPLIITEAEIDELVRRFEPALDETMTWVKDQGLKAA